MMEELRIKLEEVYSGCNEDNWSEGYLGISSPSLNYALEFTRSLNSIKVLPEVVPFASGNLGLEWNIRSSEIIVTLMFEIQGNISFSMLAPDVDNCGSFNYSATNIKFLVDRIKRVLETGE